MHVENETKTESVKKNKHQKRKRFGNENHQSFRPKQQTAENEIDAAVQAGNGHEAKNRAGQP